MSAQSTVASPSEVSVSSSLYFRRRHGRNTTNQEASGQGSLPIINADGAESSHNPDSALNVKTAGLAPQSPPRLTPKDSLRPENTPFDQGGDAPINTLAAADQTLTAGARTGQTQLQSSSHQRQDSEPLGESQQDQQRSSPSLPQHLQDGSLRYYKIVYRGVVALCSDPTNTSEKSGAYLSYGEIIESRLELHSEQNERYDPSTPKRNNSLELDKLKQSCETTRQPSSKPMIPERSTSASSIDTVKTSCKTELPTFNANEQTKKSKIVRVDRVLTGGYAMDATDVRIEAYDKTPKRANNSQNPVSVVGPSPFPLSNIPSMVDASAQTLADSKRGHGFIWAKRNEELILAPVKVPPKCEYGTYLYKVTSSTPLAVFTGPCLDSPRTKGMLIPATLHEICLRLHDPETQICFLRLTRRRGWVVDRKISRRKQAKSKFTTVMQEVIGEKETESDYDASFVPVPSTLASAANRRHRPPRKNRDLKNTTDSLFQYQVVAPSASNLSQTHHEPLLNAETFSQSQPHDKGVLSPSSNVSLLSDESSSLEHSHKQPGTGTPDRSVARTVLSNSTASRTYFLMRVNAPRGLRILDAPHFQVNNLIHGNHPTASASASPKDLVGQTGNQSIFQTMAGHHTTTITSKIANPAVFDSVSKARKLPRGSVFEASKRMESSGAFHQGAALIKLSDNSGWAIVPKQEELDEQYRNYSGSLAGIKEGEATRAFEEVGNAMVDERQQFVYLRIIPKGGISVSLPPSCSTTSDDETSPTSSAAGSSMMSGNGGGSHLQTNDSDVASSVGSSFLDAMFRTPKKREAEHRPTDGRREPVKPVKAEKLPFSTVIPCGTCVEVERWVTNEDNSSPKNEFARLRGGQGWIPLFANGKVLAESISTPETRFGSFWFRVQDQGGIKVRLGPSKRAPSIKSDDGVYFRFECGEFLRASEVVTFFRHDAPSESFAKLYRNRHARLQFAHGGPRPLASVTVQAEWVQIFGNNELYLEECTAEPRIERHKQGWRYNVVLDAKVKVRKGPSFAADTTGVMLLGGESVLINERVIGPGATVTWLRLKDGQGWVHNIGQDGESLMIAHSLRHRTIGRPSKSGRERKEDIPYNTIIARLFHSDVPEDGNNGVGATSKGNSRR